MSAHTPGPWTHYVDTTPAGETGRQEIVALGRTVARLYYEDAQGAADARLIKAAPKLLEAAERALALIEEGAPGWGVAKDLLRAAIHEARAK